MTYQTYSNPFAARAARQTTSFKEPVTTAPKPPKSVFTQPTLYGGGQVPGLPAGVTNANLAQTLFGNVSGATAGTAPASSGYTPYDIATDPIYQQIKQIGAKNVSDAVSGADALRKQALINLGDPGFAHAQQFGDPANPTYGDVSTEQAAAQNPYSTLAQYGKSHTGNIAGIDQATNDAGGYYSSTHANRLGDEDTRYHQAITDATSATGSNLTGIIDQVLAAKQAQQQAEIQAAQTATTNAINAAIAGGYSFGGFDANGQPILTKNTGAPASTPTSGGGDTAPADTAPPESSGSPSTFAPLLPSPFGPGNQRKLESAYAALQDLAAGLGPPNAYLTNRNKRG